MLRHALLSGLAAALLAPVVTAAPYADYLRTLAPLPAALHLSSDGERLEGCDLGPENPAREAADRALLAQAEAQARSLDGGPQAAVGAALLGDEQAQARIEAQAAAIANLPPEQRLQAAMQLAQLAQGAAPKASPAQTLAPLQGPASRCLAPLLPELTALAAELDGLQRDYASLRQRAAQGRVPCPETHGELPAACTAALWKQVTLPFADGSAALIAKTWSPLQARLQKLQKPLADCIDGRESAEADAIRAGAVRPGNLAMHRYSSASLDAVNRYDALRQRACAAALPPTRAARWRDPAHAYWGFAVKPGGDPEKPSAFALHDLP